MDDKNILSKVSDTLTDEPIIFSISINTEGRFRKWLQKVGYIPKERTFAIRPITYGNLVRISAMIRGIEVESLDQKKYLSTAFKLLEENAYTVSEIIATAITNSKHKPGKDLIDFLYYNLTAKETESLLAGVISAMNVSPFLTTIVSVCGMNVLETSLPETGEIIAPGI